MALPKRKVSRSKIIKPCSFFIYKQKPTLRPSTHIRAVRKAKNLINFKNSLNNSYYSKLLDSRSSLYYKNCNIFIKNINNDQSIVLSKKDKILYRSKLIFLKKKHKQSLRYKLFLEKRFNFYRITEHSICTKDYKNYCSGLVNSNFNYLSLGKSYENLLNCNQVGTKRYESNLETFVFL